MLLRAHLSRHFGQRFNEAEARAPRMPAAKPDSNIAAMLASMRPRRVRLGCAVHDLVALLEVAASMRPRRVRLGCVTRSMPVILAITRFNEAEARAPRMQPPYNPLHTKAILARFRPVAPS